LTDTSTINNKLLSAYELHKLIHQKPLILAYHGDVTQELIKAFFSLAKEKLNKENEDNRVKRQVFHVIIESLHNLSKYSYNPIPETLPFPEQDCYYWPN